MSGQGCKLFGVDTLSYSFGFKFRVMNSELGLVWTSV